MSKNLIIIVIALLAIAGIGGYYFFKSQAQNNYTAGNGQIQTAQDVAEFKLDAKRWQFIPEIINVKKGQLVKISINNIDTVHGINLPDFNASGDDTIEFTADKIGEFTFFCKNYCGDGHKDMTGKIIVTE